MMIKEGISKLEDESDILVKEKEEIIASEEYHYFIDLNDKKIELEAEIKKLIDSLYADFSIFNRPFKKYKRNADQYENLIEHYRTDSLNALLADNEFKILEILEEISGSIEKGELCSKDKKAQKVIKQINMMNPPYFRDFVKEYNLITENKEKIDSKISENKAEKKIEEIDRRQDYIKSEIGRMNLELESAKHDFAKKLKQCPKCGMEIPAEWQYHKECGWDLKKSKEVEDNEALGKSKIDVFTSPTCPHCHPALDLAKEIGKERDDVRVRELSTATPQGRRKAERLGVMAVPTIFVRGPAYPQNIGLKGLPTKKSLLKAIDISLGKAEWEEPKGFFSSLLEKMHINIK